MTIADAFFITAYIFGTIVIAGLIGGLAVEILCYYAKRARKKTHTAATVKGQLTNNTLYKNITKGA